MDERAIPTRKITSPEIASDLLSQGGIVAFPTETVFGLGADATNQTAVERLFIAKGRPADNPLIVHLANAADWHLAAEQLTPVAEELLARFAPGPISVVLPKRKEILPQVTGGLNTVAIRIPGCSVARHILAECQLPIAAPSANLSGRPSATRWQTVWEDLSGKVDAVFCLNSSRIGLESTVVDCCGSVPIVLRSGGISIDEIRELFPHARLLDSQTPKIESSQPTAPNSPGLRHAHYRPDAPVRLFAGQSDIESELNYKTAAYCSLGNNAAPEADWLISREFQDIEEYAREFYEFLREADRKGAKLIVVEYAPGEGIGLALRDRQLRAAGDVSPPDDNASTKT
ncbi:MAG: L-threonylcarbamoyladenylate synthase [Planctomycetota bacterium]|nr:L-threonylcarbamoyladenylate synthase [Planctomycetota bacterium]